MSILINSSYAQSLANFEDPILGIKFQYPTEWDPVTLTQKGNLNTIKFNNPYYTTKFPDTLLESRNTSDVQLKIQNFFPLEINLLQNMDKVFSKARFLQDFKVVELAKMATFGGSSAYKLIYTYVDKDIDHPKMISTNIFTIKNNIVYSISSILLAVTITSMNQI